MPKATGKETKTGDTGDNWTQQLYKVLLMGRI